MTVGMHYSRFQQGIIRGFYDYRDEAMIQRLEEVVSDIAVETEKGKVASLWKTAGMTLAKTSYDPLKAARVIGDRNVESLANVVRELTAKAKAARAAGPPADNAAKPGLPVAAAPAAVVPPAPIPARPAVHASAAPTHDELKSALKAFKKRLKLTKLDADSKLSARLVTGRRTEVLAISPPSEFRRSVWEQLVKEGKLKSAGSGMYEMVGS